MIEMRGQGFRATQGGSWDFAPVDDGEAGAVVLPEHVVPCATPQRRVSKLAHTKHSRRFVVSGSRGGTAHVAVRQRFGPRVQHLVEFRENRLAVGLEHGERTKEVGPKSLR